MYVIQHLNVDAANQHCLKFEMKSIREFACTHLVQMQWNPRYRQLIKQHMKAPPGQPINSMLREQMDALRKLYQERDTILRDLMKQDESAVRSRITEENPLVRLVAIEVAAKKRLPLQKELIARLADPYPLVRQSARQALVRLARSTDFGPEPTATGPQIAMAMHNWNAWLALQQDSPGERPSESSQK